MWLLRGFHGRYRGVVRSALFAKIALRGSYGADVREGVTKAVIFLIGYYFYDGKSPACIKARIARLLYRWMMIRYKENDRKRKLENLLIALLSETMKYWTLDMFTISQYFAAIFPAEVWINHLLLPISDLQINQYTAFYYIMRNTEWYNL